MKKKELGEPTFEQACQWWPDMENIWTTLGWRDHLCRFNVLWSGAIVADPAASRRAQQWQGLGALFSFIPGSGEKWHEWIFRTSGQRQDDNGFRQGWHPEHAALLWTETCRERFQLRVETFAYLAGGQPVERGDEPLYAWVRLSLKDMFPQLPSTDRYCVSVLIENAITGTMPRRQNVIFSDPRQYGHALNARRRDYDRQHGYDVVQDDGSVRIAVAPGLDCTAGLAAPLGCISGHRLNLGWRPTPANRIDLLIPMVPCERRKLRAVLARGFDVCLAETDQFWKKQLAATPTRLDIPEGRINEANARGVFFSHVLTEKDPASGRYCKINGSMAYTSLWSTPGAMDLVMLMDTLGYHSFVERYLDIFAAEQGTVTPPGLPSYEAPVAGNSKAGGIFGRHPGYLCTPARYKAVDWLSDNGAILYALAMHGLLSGNAAYLDRFTDPIIKSCEWIRDARAMRKTGGYEGVLPPAVNTDAGTVVQGVWAAAWNYLGLRKAVTLLRRIGHPRAAEFERECRAYRVAFVEAYRDRLRTAPRWKDRRGRVRLVPPAALTGETEDDWTIPLLLDAGPLVLAFTGLLSPSDPAIRDLLAWFREGPPRAVFAPESNFYQAQQLIHEASSSELCYSWNIPISLATGDRARFLEGLYSVYAGGLSRKTWISCETRGGIYGNVFVIPFAVFMARLALVDDHLADDELHLLRLVTQTWLEGRGVTARALPTEYGPVDLSARLLKSGSVLDVRFAPHYRWAPQRTILHVPPFAALETVRLNGRVVWRCDDRGGKRQGDQSVILS